MADPIHVRLINAYRDQLLADPPLKSLQPEQENRAHVALALAKKDVRRFLHALDQAALILCDPRGLYASQILLEQMEMEAKRPAPANGTQPAAHEQHQAAPEDEKLTARAKAWRAWTGLVTRARAVGLKPPVISMQKSTEKEIVDALKEWSPLVEAAEAKR